MKVGATRLVATTQLVLTLGLAAGPSITAGHLAAILAAGLMLAPACALADSGSGGSGSGGSGSGSSGGGSGSSGSGSSGSGSSGSGGSGSGSSGSSDDISDADEGEYSSNDRATITRIEVSSDGVRIRYSDGSSERIDRGFYEHKSADGRTIEKRRATGADVSRLRAISKRSDVDNVRVPDALDNTAAVSAARVDGNDVEIVYSNGWRETLLQGRYELKDAYGRTVAKRPALQADLIRMSNAASH